MKNFQAVPSLVSQLPRFAGRRGVQLSKGTRSFHVEVVLGVGDGCVVCKGLVRICSALYTHE